MSNQELAKELHKPIIRKLEKRKIHSSFTDKIWVADLADMQLISKFDKEFVLNKEFYKEFHYVTDIYCKCASVVSLKDKKGITITNAFENILDQPNCKTIQNIGG